MRTSAEWTAAAIAAASLAFLGCGGLRTYVPPRDGEEADGGGTDAADLAPREEGAAQDDGAPPDAADAGEDGGAACFPGRARCGADGERERCTAGGAWEDDPCPEGAVCDGEGECLEVVCTAGESRCDPADPTQLEECVENGTAWRLAEICTGGQVCEYGACVPQTCAPGDTVCTSDGRVRTCNESGTGFGDPEECREGFVCDGDECVAVICAPAAAECMDPARRRVCNRLGTGYTVEECPAGTACAGGECRDRVCEPFAKRCDPADPMAWQQCNPSGTAWGAGTACREGQGCREGSCLTRICVPGSATCAPGGRIRRCDASGTFWSDPASCPAGQACDEGTCAAVICTPGESACRDMVTVRVCNETGTRHLDQPCGGGYMCEAGQCRLQVCIPGLRQCSGGAAYQQCNDLGTGWTAAGTCNASTGERCFEGACQTLCQQAELAASSIGCVFYGVDLDQADELGADGSPYAIVVSNTHDTLAATVTVQDRRGTGGTWRTLATQSIAPNNLYAFRMPSDQHVEDTNVGAGYAYRVTSTIPVIAYQFNPIDSAGQYTNDASLLLPKATLGRHYWVTAWPKYPGRPYYSNVTVAGAQDATSVTITVPVATLAGGGIPALGAGGSVTRTINEGDVLQLANSGEGGDMTGTYVQSDKPVAVYGGCECADVPLGCSWCRNYAGGVATQCHWCDHVEEQMFPVTTWGQRAIAARVPVRSAGGVEASYWKVVASESGTTVTVSYAAGTVLRSPAGAPPWTMGRGQVIHFEMAGTRAAPGDALVEATKPILVAQYIEGQECTDQGAGGGGDPAMILMVPVEQYLSEYIFLVPSTYSVNYVVVVKPTSSTVTLDGAAVGGTSYPVASGWEIRRPSVAPGVHRIQSAQPFGIIGVGYAPYVSYGYMGGLSLRVINPL